MADASDTKGSATHHVERSYRRATHGDEMIIPYDQEQRDAQELQEIYHVPMKEVLESHLDQDPKVVKRILRKVDWRLVPMLSILFMWAFIDRANLGNVS